MSFTSIPNQPIIFSSNTAVECPGCGSDNYKQLLDYNDQVFFQVESTPCVNSVLYKYDTVEAAWGVPVDNKVCSTELDVSGIYCQLLTTNYHYQLYQVEFTILTLDEGSLTIGMNGSSTYELTLPGTYTLYFNNPILTGNSVTLCFGSNSWIGCLSTNGIRVYGLASENQMKVGVVDAVTLEYVDAIGGVYTVKDNKITCGFDLTNLGLGEGCYRFAIADFCTNTCGQNYLYNGVFRDAHGVAGWTTSTEFDATVTLSEASALFDFPYEDSAAYLVNQVEACTGLTYRISIYVESRSNVNIAVQIGDEIVFFGAGTGLLTVDIVGGNPSTFGTQISIYAQNSGVGPGYLNITRIDTNTLNVDIQWDLFSNVVSIGDYNDECKYFNIEGCNAEDQFNLAFGGSSFLPAIRLEGRKFRAQYVTEVNNFRFASGRYQTTYVDREKKWTFAFGRLPEYVLDFLSTIFYYDNCYINGDLYYAIDGEFPDIEYNDADELGALSIDLALKSSKVRKTICSNTDADCLPSILDNADEPFLLAQDEQRLTTENSVNLYQEIIL